MQTGNDLKFEYIFNIEEGQSLKYSISISKDDIISKTSTPQTPPQWTNLENNKCPHCTLKDTQHCPVAIRLVEPIKIFHDLSSHKKTKVTVITDERQYSKDTDIQDGLRSMFGLIMATSGCPSMNVFKPMALYHLPFSSVNETIYRVVSMYLIGSFIKHKDQTSMPINIDDIEAIYDTIQEVNIGMLNRLKQCVENDSTLNAITILDSIASMIPFKLEKNLDYLEEVFS